MTLVIDCRNEQGESFNLDGDTKKSVATQAYNQIETRKKPKSNAFKCKSDEDITEHQNLVQLLSRYGMSKSFGHYLQQNSFKLGPTHLRTLSISELKEYLIRVRACVNAKNITNFWEEAAFGIVKTTELICSNTSIKKRFDPSGVTEALRNDQTFRDCLCQLELEMGDITAIPVHYRIMYSIVGAMTKQHAINQYIKKQKLFEPQQEGETKNEPREEGVETKNKTNETNALDFSNE